MRVLYRLRLLGGYLALLIVTKAAFADTGAEVQPDNLFPQVKIETNLGDIIVELDRYRAPITTNNFLAYATSGGYDGTLFHRVVTSFVVQGGGYDILFNERPTRKPIFNESGNGLKNEPYTIAMARDSDPHSATNQFYFNLSDNTSLDPGQGWGYTVFGSVLDGIDVVEAIGRAKTRVHPEFGWEDVPVKQWVIKKVTVMPEA